MSDLTALIVQARLGAAGEIPKPVKTAEAEAAREAAESFEAFFLAQFLGEMFKDIRSDSMFGGGAGEDAYRPLLIQEYGKLMAARGGTGLADAVLREILATQEIGE